MFKSITIINIKYLLATILVLLLFGCSSSGNRAPDIVHLDVDMLMPPAGTSELSPDTIGRIMDEIENRNRKVEDTPEWIEKAYEGLLVRRLTNLSHEEFPRYKKYLDNGAAYVIVHPAFFPFFHYPKKLRHSDKDKYKTNVVELLLKLKPRNPQFAVLQAQERRMRDFIEFKSTQKKLVIVVVPRDYNSYTGYTYRRHKDEYMRYLNEVTNFSESILFIESRSPNRGYLTDDDAVRLMEFLLSIEADTVFVGGGYIGRCLEDFYSLITKEYGAEGIYVVPELSDLSPREINGPLALKLLKPDGRIDKNVARRMIESDVFGVQELIPKIMSLP
jgi:hypothetical protein